MKKIVPITVRIEERDREMLDELVENTVRKHSDMIRFLIRQEWNKLHHVENSNIPAVEVIQQG